MTILFMRNGSDCSDCEQCTINSIGKIDAELYGTLVQFACILVFYTQCMKQKSKIIIDLSIYS